MVEYMFAKYLLFKDHKFSLTIKVKTTRSISRVAGKPRHNTMLMLRSCILRTVVRHLTEKLYYYMKNRKLRKSVK